jgi:hypothetical protein
MFEGFQGFKDEILSFAQQKSAYSSKEEALNEQLCPPPKKHLPLGSIQTTSREIAEQLYIGSTSFSQWCDPGVYHHIKGKVEDETIEAVIPEQGGVGLYSINGQQAREYCFGESTSGKADIGEEDEELTVSLRFEEEQYQYLQEALFFWLNEEFCLISSEARNRH